MPPSPAHGIASNSAATVIATDAKKTLLTVQTADGSQVAYNPVSLRSQTTQSTVYRQESRELATGERIQFPAPSKEQGIRTRDFGTVSAIVDSNALAVRLDNGKTVELGPGKARHIKHGYAVDGLKAVYAERVLVSIEGAAHISREDPLYKAVSRVCRNTTIYASDPSSVHEKVAAEKAHAQSVSRLVIDKSIEPALSPMVPAQTHPTQFQIDNRIEVEVQQALRKPVFAGMTVLSSVNHGVVTLGGTATSEAAKELASSEVGNIEGVKTVLNNLNILNASAAARPAAPTPKPVEGPSGPRIVTMPANTALAVRLTDEIDTKAAKTGDTFHGTTASTVSSGGFTLIPSGTEVTGRIVEAKAAGHFSGSAELAIELVSIRLPGASGPQEAPIITEQLSNKAAGRGANTAEKAGGGAGLGAIVGALAGGGAGAGIGAASGGALGLGANAITRGKEIDLKPEQLLRFRTASPLEVTVMLRNGKQVLPRTLAEPTLERQPAAPGSPSL